MNLRNVAFALTALAAPATASPGPAEEPSAPWTRHTIDDTSQGADGVRLADANGDGFLDVATGWEEGGLVRVYLNPGPSEATQPWPRVTAGQVPSPEDAVLVDLDGNGTLDVVSATEGETRTLWVHWAPEEGSRFLDSEAWRTEPIPASQGARPWMYVLPLDVNDDGRTDLVAGAKAPDARIGWFEAPPDPRRLGDWRWHSLLEAGWVMSLVARDMDGDGDEDVVASDRKGPNRGVLWLENPGPSTDRSPWPEHRLGAEEREVMFLTLADLDGSGIGDVLVSTKPREIVLLQRRKTGWVATAIPTPDTAGTAKAVATGDIDGDGALDVAFSCEGAEDRSGVMWLSHDKTPAGPSWTPHDISGPEGTKFDLVELIDLDADGDLDVLTCEEREGLGVVWYENPHARAGRQDHR